MDFSQDAATPPSKYQIRKGKRTLEEAIANGRLSPEDIAYIKAATDTYHDTPIHSVNGIPDEYVGKSITEALTITMDVKTPYSAGTGNWNARIYNYPLLGSANVVTTDNLANLFNQRTGTVNNTTGVATMNVDYSTGNFSDYPTYSERGSLEQNALEGEVKIIGMGIEVINTTAELYKQGMCTIARIPQTQSNKIITGKVFGNDPAGTAGSFAVQDMIPIMSMPTTLSELTTYPNYAQWEAKEGAYAIVKQYDTQSSCPSGYRGAVRWIDKSTNATAVGATWGNIVCDTTKIDWTSGVSMPVPSYALQHGYISAPMDTICMMFTGLSEQTSLTVRAKLIIERRVNSSMIDLAALVPLAKESPPLNPLALELVSCMWSNLPTAVMFKENPAGEWWNKVMGAIGEWGPSILGLIPHPIAQAAARSLPAVTRALKTNNSDHEEVERLKRELEKMKLRQQSIVSQNRIKSSPPKKKQAPRPQPKNK